MNRETIRNAIYQKYITPTQRKANDFVGAEFELPIVNLNKEAVDFDIIHSLAEAFVNHFAFDKTMTDDDGNIYSALKSENGDDLSFDCSYNTLELSFGKVSDLNVVHSRFKEYYAFIQGFLAPYSHTLTGMGINPYREYNLKSPIPNERYRMLFHHLKSYTKYNGDFHSYPDFGLFAAANQVQLDVEENDITKVINTFYLLEPFKAIIFANSPLEDMLCSRDFLWKKSLHGLNPKNVDGYERPLENNEDVISYIENMSLYCVMRNGRYINFAPTPLDEYFEKESIEGEFFNGSEYENITFDPELEDLQYLRSFKFEDLTFRGTVEFRSVCTQPVKEIMTSPAFHAGLMKKIDELCDILTADTVLYNHSLSADELREIINKGAFPEFADKDKVKELLYRIIDLAASGLMERGYNEEHFLIPLYHRADHLFSPAKQMIDGINSGVDLEYYIKEYAEI
ncbi:MAG: glutamylcysteine synthetase [Eubacterium sp.]|nr:glutamylcysteine synthetase [Eubacterium sp.]